MDADEPSDDRSNDRPKGRSGDRSDGESDEALMARVQSGPAEEEAIALLFRRYQRRLFGFLIRRCGEAATAEDLIQETWIRVSRARDSYDPRRRFSTWLFQIANNLCRDRGRRRLVERRGAEHMQQSLAMERPLVEGAADPLLRMEMDELLSALPDRLREVVVLRYHEQLSEGEIAEVAGIPRGTVKSRLHAAMRALREALTPGEGPRNG